MIREPAGYLLAIARHRRALDPAPRYKLRDRAGVDP